MPWAFLGFETAVHVADRHAFPRSRLFAVMAAAILAAALCYAGFTLLAIQHVPEGFAGWQDYVASLGKLEGPDSIPTFFVMQATFGRAGLVLLEATAMATLGTSLLGYLIVCLQLVCTLAESGVLPEALGRRSADGLPEGAMHLVPALCVTAPFLGRTVIEWFMPVITLGCTLAYGYTSASAYCAARAEGRPAARAAGAAGTAIACLLALVLLIPTSWGGASVCPESHLILAVWSVLGLLVFRFAARRGGAASPHARSPLVWTALFFLIFFCSAMWMCQAGLHAAREACGNVAGYFGMQLEAATGHARGQEAARDLRETERQMQKVADRLVVKQLVQGCVVLCALWLLYGILRSMHACERLLEMKQMRAEERRRARHAFLFHMSHDLRMPMNAIIGYANLAAAGAPQPGSCAAISTRSGMHPSTCSPSSTTPSR